MSETPSTPGSQALVNVKAQENAVVEFKKPSGGVLKGKPKILTEEKYIEELSKIIQRDFFPDLDRLRAQNDYLDAMDRKDYAQMEAIRAKFSGRRPTERSGSLTPATFETPASTCNSTPKHGNPIHSASDTPKSSVSQMSTTSAQGNTTQTSISEKHSLDSFLQAYTSEDNYSFQEIIETAEKKLRDKFAVLYNEEKISAEKLALALTLPSIEKQFEEPDPMRKIETWSYRNKNSIMYIPDGVELTENERVDAAKHRQSVQHSATRLSVNPFENSSSSHTNPDNTLKKQSDLANTKIGMDGNVIDPNKGAVPQIRGFDLVKTPSPRPGEAYSPLMTWGEIEGTPFRLDGSDTPVRSIAGPSFKITENSRRENIALALAEKVGEKMRAQKQRAIDTARRNINSPFIRSNMERLASMSPAARRLATTKLGLRTPIVTPLPPSRPSSSLRNSRNSSNKSTPVLTSPFNANRKIHSGSRDAFTTKNSSKDNDSEKSTLTDDLLKIPTKRLKASDFF